MRWGVRLRGLVGRVWSTGILQTEQVRARGKREQERKREAGRERGGERGRERERKREGKEGERGYEAHGAGSAWIVQGPGIVLRLLRALFGALEAQGAFRRVNAEGMECTDPASALPSATIRTCCASDAVQIGLAGIWDATITRPTAQCPPETFLPKGDVVVTPGVMVKRYDDRGETRVEVESATESNV